MELRPLGAAGLRVTPIGLGLAALGRPGYITLDRAKDLGSDRSVAALERRSHEVLSAAYDAGVRYFDAARSYGFAERFLGSWLRERSLPPKAITVGSKWGYTYVGDWQVEARVHEVKDHSLAALRRQIAESRALLGEYLDLYQIHSATLESGVLDDYAVLSELNALRVSGLTIGLSVSGPRQADVIRRALAVSVDGVNAFQSVQATWNLFEPSAGPALAEAHQAGWGVIIKEALANGRLADRDQHAIAAALANSWVDVVLSGAVTEAQLRSNVGALTTPLLPDELAALSKLAEPPDRYWEERSQLAWR
ncbi:MAG: aldo/keto reductase [Chloroflexi bacterium]|nr:MAG: aldo/keto reductase [Chloroflexota bacterium]